MSFTTNFPVYPSIFCQPYPAWSEIINPYPLIYHKAPLTSTIFGLVLPTPAGRLPSPPRVVNRTAVLLDRPTMRAPARKRASEERTRGSEACVTWKNPN
eukprot:761361-Hanusia_phi.AAC.5